MAHVTNIFFSLSLPPSRRKDDTRSIKKSRATRRRGAVTMWKYETFYVSCRIPASSSSFLSIPRSHQCSLHRSPMYKSDVYWGKMGANQSTRSDPIPGEEGKPPTLRENGRAFIYLWVLDTLHVVIENIAN